MRRGAAGATLLERHARNPFDLGDREAHRVERHARLSIDVWRLAEIQSARQLADDQQIGARRNLRLEWTALPHPGQIRGPQVRAHAEALRKASSPPSGRRPEGRWSNAGSPTAPSSTPSARRQASRVSAGNAGNPRLQRDTTNRMALDREERPKREFTVSSTSRAAARTSGPMPSPGSSTMTLRMGVCRRDRLALTVNRPLSPVHQFVPPAAGTRTHSGVATQAERAPTL